MPRPGRNDPCPCGSGKKFKQCCASKKDRSSRRSSRCSSPAWFWRSSSLSRTRGGRRARAWCGRRNTGTITMHPGAKSRASARRSRSFGIAYEPQTGSRPRLRRDGRSASPCVDAAKKTRSRPCARMLHGRSGVTANSMLWSEWSYERCRAQARWRRASGRQGERAVAAPGADHLPWYWRRRAIRRRGILRAGSARDGIRQHTVGYATCRQDRRGDGRQPRSRWPRSAGGDAVPSDSQCMERPRSARPVQRLVGSTA